tara:strand:- start:588 stop:1223 length:636 start_codon:yes stop_codon:yes gene_type:complete
MFCGVNVSKVADGKISEYTKWMLEWSEIMNSKGIPNSIKSSVSGDPEPYVYAVTMSKDAKEFGEKTEEVRSSSDFQSWFAKAANERISHGIDSFMMDLQPGNDDAISLSEGVIVGNVWEVLDFETFYGNVAKSREIHEKHGGLVRSWNIIGGRYSGCMQYNVSFASLSAWGKFMEDVREDQNAFYQEVMAQGKISANSMNQVVLDNPVMVK